MLVKFYFKHIALLFLWWLFLLQQREFGVTTTKCWRMISRVQNKTASHPIPTLPSCGAETISYAGQKVYSMTFGYHSLRAKKILYMIYLFKGARFQEFHEYDLSVGPSMKIEEKWKGVPTKIDAALQWKNGKTYFFKNNKYWRFNDNKMAVSKDYPKSRTTYWMGCGMPDGQDLPAKFVLAPRPSVTHGTPAGK